MLHLNLIGSFRRLLLSRRVPPLSKLIIAIGRHSYGVENIKLISFSDQYHLRIGSFCSIAGDVTILLGGDHRIDWASTYPFGHINQDIFPKGLTHGVAGHPCGKGDIIIEDDVWIGYGSIILSGVTLGTGCCIGAHAVVTKSIPPYAIAAGNPAKVVKTRFDQDVIDILQRVAWWNLPDEIINEIVPLLQVQCNLSIAMQIQAKCLELSHAKSIYGNYEV